MEIAALDPERASQRDLAGYHELTEAAGAVDRPARYRPAMRQRSSG
jgi:hypothetical protein